MPTVTRIVPWIDGSCSLYAVERNGICLPAEFMRALESVEFESARQLWLFLAHHRRAPFVREAQIRPERPELGVYALYNHREFFRSPYNPSRLLCSYIRGANNILLVGSGFIKRSNQPIQKNEDANRQAMFLSSVARQLNTRIDTGEILTAGSRLISTEIDSFTF